MKMLKLSPYGEPEQISSSHLAKDLYETYINEGIYVENYVPMPCRGISKEVRKAYKKKRYEELYNGHVIVHRFSMFPEGKNPVLRALRYILVNIIQYFKGIRAQNIDFIYGGSTPPTQGILCALVKKRLTKKYKKEVPFVYVLQDIFPDSLVNAKMTKKESLIWNIGRRMEDYTYRNANKIIVIGDDFKANILEKGVPEEKIVIIRNWVDENVVKPIPRENNRLVDRYRLDPTKFYVTYCGNIGHSQNFEMLIEVAKKIEKDKDIEILLIGEGAYKQTLERIIKENNINNIRLLPFQPYEDIAHVYSIGDVGLVISKPGIGSSSVPSKAWSILSSATPILASFDVDSELCRLISENQCGLCATPGDVEEFISKLYMIKSGKNHFGERGREFIINNLSKNICTRKYVEVFKDSVNL